MTRKVTADRTERGHVTEEESLVGLPVTHDPQTKSGVPPARSSRSRAPAVEADEHAQLALAESTRSEANLNLLLRGLQHLVEGAKAAHRANAALTEELDALREALAQCSAEEMSLQGRVRLLELALERSKRDALEQVSEFVAQEDAFLAELLDDHEREVRELRAKLKLAEDQGRQKDPEPETVRRPASSPIGAVNLRTITQSVVKRSAEAESSSLRPLSTNYALGRGEVRDESFSQTLPRRPHRSGEE